MSEVQVGDLAVINKDYYGILYDTSEFKGMTGLVVGVNENFYYEGRGRIRGDQFVVLWPNGIGKHPSGALNRAEEL